MIADAQERLIQDALEGEATPAQAGELKRLLETNPEIRTRYEEMGEVFRMLSESAPVEPPTEMHAEIMRAIASESGAPARPSRRSHARPWSWAPAAGAFLAGAAAAALVVVSLLHGPRVGRFLGGSPESGTMAPVESERGAIVSRESIVAGSTRVELVTRRAGDDVRLEVHARGETAVDLEVQYPPDALGLTGLGWSRSPRGPVTTNAGRVSIGAMTPGDLVLTFVARGTPAAPVRVSVGGAGSALLRTAPHVP